jgi:hypothetical protein
MKAIQFNKSMTKAIKAIGEAGYEIRSIYIAEASYGKNKLDYALFVAKVDSIGQTHEVTVSVNSKSAKIIDIQVINQ